MLLPNYIQTEKARPHGTCTIGTGGTAKQNAGAHILAHAPGVSQNG